MDLLTGHLRTSAAVAGAVIIGAYVMFGFGPADIRKRRKKKDQIPGLANVGNSCFLNALVQSLASCPLFIKWLSSKYSDTAPPLVSSLYNLLRVLNNESGLGGDVCAGEVLSALRDHGWVISSEEQDTHELFHVLTATIDDELVNVSPVPSLLDVSWVDDNSASSLEYGVVLKTIPWGEVGESGGNVQKEKFIIRNKLHLRCKMERDVKNDSKCSKVNGVFIEGKGRESHLLAVNGPRDHSDSNECTVVKSPSADVEDGNGESCDSEGCEGRAEDSVDDKEFHVSDNQGEDSAVAQKREEMVNGDNSSCESTVNKETSSCGTSADVTSREHKAERVTESVISECDGRENSRDLACNSEESEKPRLAFVTTRMQGTATSQKKVRSDNHDSPFRGYLASQLQCITCGHKNPAQWTSFESLSLSLPSLPWGEVTLQELLDSYITQEKVTDVTCDGCSKRAGNDVKTIFNKQLTIGKLPDCLCFHIKRTVWLENGSAIKRRDHLTFPEFLIMDPYTYTTSITSQGLKNHSILEQEKSSVADTTDWLRSGCQQPLSSVMSENATSTNLDASPFIHVTSVRYEQLYRLKAVIVHVGDVFCGHFVTYRRGPIGSRTRNRWFYTSDLLVREATLEEVQKANAYMILYEKMT